MIEHLVGDPLGAVVKPAPWTRGGPSYLYFTISVIE
jgi:hypothetical protein